MKSFARPPLDPPPTTEPPLLLDELVTLLSGVDVFPHDQPTRPEAATVSVTVPFFCVE